MFLGIGWSDSLVGGASEGVSAKDWRRRAIERFRFSRSADLNLLREAMTPMLRLKERIKSLLKRRQQAQKCLRKSVLNDKTVCKRALPPGGASGGIGSQIEAHVSHRPDRSSVAGSSPRSSCPLSISEIPAFEPHADEICIAFHVLTSHCSWASVEWYLTLHSVFSTLAVAFVDFVGKPHCPVQLFSCQQLSMFNGPRSVAS